MVFIMEDFLNLFDKIKNRNNIEFTTSPYYHPIMPLLIASYCVKDMGITLPKLRFSHPEDALDQLDMGLAFMRKYGIEIKGIWPSEGSLDEKSIEMIKEKNIKYVGSDEKILHAILKDISPKGGIYTYKNLGIFFRDREISDRIAFKYSYLNENDAVEDFLDYVSRNDGLTIVIMDGENAWEYFDNNGLNFLSHLYERMEAENFNTYTLETAYHAFNNGDLDHFVAGSWIDVGFPLWIGSEGKNRSWDLLTLVRNHLDSERLNQNEMLKKQLFAIEGSDWNWWYDTFYGTEGEKNFDILYRKHILNLLEMAQIDIDFDLNMPIQKLNESIYYREPVRLINPTINGIEDNFYEWVYAGFLDTKNISGTMKENQYDVRKVFFGFNENTFFIRMDFTTLKFDTIKINIYKEDINEIVINMINNSVKINDKETDKIIFAIDEIIEIAIPFDLMNIQSGEGFLFNFHLLKENKLYSMIPTFSHISCFRPDKFFKISNWRV